MRIMCDTNMILDVMLEREPFIECSASVLQLCENHTVTGFVTASSITDIFYLVRKQTHSNDTAYKAIGKVLEIVKVCNVTNDDVVKAYTPRCCKMYIIFWYIFHLAALSSLPCESTPASSALPAEKYPQNLMYILQQRGVYHKKAKDFEDCLLAVCAESNNCDYIVTRNIKDFKGFSVTAIEPAEFIKQIGL